MTFVEFLSSKAVTLCVLMLGALLSGSCLLFAGASPAFAAFFECMFFSVVALWLAAGFLWDRHRLRQLELLLTKLPQQYLLGEILPKPVGAVEKKYFEAMQAVSRSAIGAVEAANRDKEDYCNYVESWIHELKTPLTACSLILSNDGDVRKLKRELKRADNLTESILYYARLRTAEKDTTIKQVQAAAVIEEAVKSQAEILIASRICVHTEGDFSVYTDAKSLCFILKQLLINSANYCPGCKIQIFAKDRQIVVEDNGIGIADYELSRVTERGFTGSNGRRRGGSTGMGVYIVKELCKGLDIRLRIESQQNVYTRITLAF